MLFGVTVLPLGAGDSILRPVADVVQRIEDAGLSYEVNGSSTVVEGAWDEVMPVLRDAEMLLREQYDRVFMLIAVDDHAGARNRLHGAVADVIARVTPALPLS